jgi:hypothetical protein
MKGIEGGCSKGGEGRGTLQEKGTVREKRINKNLEYDSQLMILNQYKFRITIK